MNIFGIDFTSAPRRGKPIMCAVCGVQGATLYVETLEALTTFEAFEALLARSGPWVGGFDFPFGQPAELVSALGWPPGWAGYVAHVAGQSMADFAADIKVFRDARPSGQKHPLRVTDARAGAISPLMLHGVPVGRMFFRGAPRLLQAGVAVWPCHRTGSDRVALETYPALVARRWIGRQSYKAEARARQTAAREAARRTVVARMQQNADEHFGVTVKLAESLADRLVEDAQGDALDAVLAALPAAWASRQVDPSYGVPATADPREGWVVDPLLL